MAKPSTAARQVETDSPRGVALLRDPMLNKGTTFSEDERDMLGLRGLLPAHVLSMEAQAKRVTTNLRQLPTHATRPRAVG
jgi:malate dehydrogenase (oxaloacetate-decarboxylating)(NADP+)